MIFIFIFIWITVGILTALGVYSCRDDLNVLQIIDVGIFWPFALICVIIAGIEQWIRRLT